MWVTGQLLRVWEANLETFYCISAFVCSSLDPHHCVLVVFLAFPSCRPLQMQLKGDLGSMSPFVQTGILPFLYCNLFCFCFTSAETFLEIGKIQLHPSNLQKSLCLSVRQYIYIFHHMLVQQGSSSFHSYQQKYMKFVPHNIVASLNNLLILVFLCFYGLLISVCFITTFKLRTIWNSTILKTISDLGTVKGNEMPWVCQVNFTVVKWRLHWCGRDSWFHYHL